MIITQLWNDYLSKTIPVADAAMLIALVQMAVGAVLPILTLLRITKHRSKAEVFGLCLVPIVLITTAAIVEPLFFGSFLGGGFSSSNMQRLRFFLDQPGFFREALLLCAVFLACSLMFLALDHLVGKTSVWKILVNMGIEYGFILVVCFASYDYFCRSGAQFSALPDPLVKWFIYGLYLLLSKSLFYLICLGCFLLFGRRIREYRFSHFSSPEEWLRHYFSQGYRMLGLALLLFAGFLFFSLTWPLSEEDSAALFYGAAAVDLAALLAGLRFLLFSFFPALLPNYRRILTWGHPELMASMLYRELMEEKPVVQMPLDVFRITAHFVIFSFPRRVFYLPLYERYVPSLDCGKFYFKDGSHFSVNKTGAEVILQICGKKPL